MKNAYVQFLMHAYIDTDVELREVYSKDTMWELFENFLPDISTVSLYIHMYTHTLLADAHIHTQYI